MGQAVGRCRELQAKVRELEEEREGARRAREAEQREFAGREDDWRRERRRLLVEAARLRGRLKGLQEEEQKKKKDHLQEEEQKKKKNKDNMSRRKEAEEAQEEGDEATREAEEQRQRQQAEVVVERMKEEQRRREEAVDKWKQLYLAIKAELDDLIQRTHHQGERFCWGAAEQQQGMIEALQRELKARDETVESLRLKISSMEKEGVRRDREIDILRQSLRILSYSKRNHRGIRRSLSRGLRM